ncbi:integrase-type DNA-binding superfamily protein [Striga asiatica]|uniref:Integrase-type DNA-binding superfamily protein n=1 Tax=Striga asiatica TaxID=4170 RepID=A0A5A7Q356_STRAF|nr:integrase-type DNA-binding superfamily protein [Striga asiatica]
MRYKSWPFYADWLEVFGKDRATGEGAMGFADAVTGVLHNNSEPIPPPTTPQDVPTYSFDPLHQIPMECSSTQVGETSASSKGKRQMKRKRGVEVEDQIVGLLSSLCENAADRLTEMAKGAGFQHAAKEQRMAVYEALSKIPHLTTSQRVAVSRYFCKNNEELDLFFSLDDDEAKIDMVHQILQDMYGKS